MRDWSYEINSLPEFRIGTVTLEDKPWWLAFLEWFAFWVDWNWPWKIKLPSWPKIEWNGSGGERYSPRDWWGSIGGIVHAYITNPLFQWVYAHPRTRRIEVPLGYDRVRELFYANDPQFFDEEDERKREMEAEGVAE